MVPFYAFIVLIFFDLNFGIANSASRALFIILFVCMLIRNKGKITISRMTIIQVIILLFLGISVAINHGSWQEIIFSLEQLLIYIFAYNYLDSDFRKVKTLKFIGIVGGGLALIGLVEYVYFVPFQTVLMRFRTTETELYIENGQGRISSTFINPIYFSVILVVTIFIVQSLNKSEKKLYWKLIWVISILALLLTRSEGGIIAFLVIELLLNLKTIRRLFTKYVGTWKVLAIAAVIVTFIVIITVGIDRTTLVSIFTARVYAWTVAIRIFINNLFIGCGLGNFDAMFHVYGKEFIEGYYFVRYAPHSDFFGMLANGGFLTIIPFIYFLVYQIKMARININKFEGNDHFKKIIIPSCSFIILYFSIHRLVDDFYSTYRVITLINIIIAMFEHYCDKYLLSPGYYTRYRKGN